MRSPLKGFLPAVPLRPTRDSQRFRFWLCSVQFDLAAWCTPQSLTRQWNAHRGAWLCRGMNTAESDSSVGSTLWSSTPQCDAHCGVFWEIWCSWLRDVMHTAVHDFHSGIHTAELDSSVGSTPRSLTPQWDGHREAQLHGGMHTAESSASNILFFRVNYVFQLRFASEVKKVP